MQSGVAMKMHWDGKEVDPKHLRVGINSAHVATAALAGILIEKGIITMEEYTEANIREMEKEAKSYEQWLTEQGGGTTITLL
jgi:hypothetical protein